MAKEKPEEDTLDRAKGVVESLEFRVETEKKLVRLELLGETLRTWAKVLVALVVLNWLHDLGASAEMLDYWDGREEGFLSTELEHEITVLMPLLLAGVPIWWGRRREKAAREAAAAAKE